LAIGEEGEKRKAITDVLIFGVNVILKTEIDSVAQLVLLDHSILFLLSSNNINGSFAYYKYKLYV